VEGREAKALSSRALTSAWFVDCVRVSASEDVGVGGVGADGGAGAVPLRGQHDVLRRAAQVAGGDGQAERRVQKQGAHLVQRVGRAAAAAAARHRRRRTPPRRPALALAPHQLSRQPRPLQPQGARPKCKNTLRIIQFYRNFN
jgi:L-aminopeptidase/D-esterase-like protein